MATEVGGDRRPSTQRSSASTARRGWGRWLLLPGGFALLTGLDAGLTLAGLPASVPSDRLADLHGPLMVIGFLGTVIALERATALRLAWGFLAPALLGAGALTLALLPDPTLGRLLAIQGAGTAVVVQTVLWRRNADPAVAVGALAVVHLLAAALLLLRLPVAAVLPLLVAFIVTMIAAERVELARLAMPRGADGRLVALTGALALVAGAAILWPDAGGRALGVVLAGLTAWLIRHDVARRTIRATGLPRFAAAAMLAGYAWLLVAAAVLVVGGQPLGGAYDVVVHATFLGFAMSMVMAHAPVILPAVLHVRLPYRPWLYLPLVLLHLTLALRVVGHLVVAHLPDAHTAWLVGAAGNVAALLVFIAAAVLAVALGARAPRRRRQAQPGGRAGPPAAQAAQPHADGCAPSRRARSQPRPTAGSATVGEETAQDETAQGETAPGDPTPTPRERQP